MIDVNLALDLAKRELKTRYINTNFGNIWYLISPIITIFIYTIIFADFMQMKMNLTNNKYSYSVYLIPGLLSWNFFVTIILRFSNLFFEKAHLIKKVSISPIVYFVSIFISEFIIYTLSLLIGVIFLKVINYPIDLEIFSVFIYAFLLGVFAFALGVIISLFVPFFKDLKEIINIALQLLFWLTPIVYVKELIYKKYPFLVDYNIIYKFIEPMQYIFLYSKLKVSFYPFIISICLLIIAYFLYKKLIGEIKDII